MHSNKLLAESKLIWKCYRAFLCTHLMDARNISRVLKLHIDTVVHVVTDYKLCMTYLKTSIHIFCLKCFLRSKLKYVLYDFLLSGR